MPLSNTAARTPGLRLHLIASIAPFTIRRAKNSAQRLFSLQFAVRMLRTTITAFSRAACDAILKLVASDAAKCGFIVAASLSLLLFSSSAGAAEIDVPQGNPVDPIVVSAPAANRWQQGSYDVWLLRGNCLLSQGPDQIRCQEAVLWIDRSMVPQAGNTKVIAYLEGNSAQPVVLTMQRGGKPVRIVDQRWFGRLFTMRDVQVQVPVVAGKPDVLPPVFQRGMEAWNPAPIDSLQHTPVQQAQYLLPQNEISRRPPAPPLPCRRCYYCRTRRSPRPAATRGTPRWSARSRRPHCSRAG